MQKKTIEDVENALRLHVNYKGKSKFTSYYGRYLQKIDLLAANYQGSLSQKVCKLLDDYFKAVGVLNLDEAMIRLRKIDKQNTIEQ